jgi:glycosyltransferase involved in cell wall biosynthesis
MMHMLVNALAASAGGGITYIRNVLPRLSSRSDVRATFVVTPALRRELSPPLPGVQVIECDFPTNAAARFACEQKFIPGLVRKCGADVLLAAGNFAIWRSPVPQILLSRNSIYTSSDYFQDLRRRGDYGRWLDTKIKGRLAAASIRRAEITVAPSEAFAADLRQWVKPAERNKIVCIHHGFDAGAFHESPPAPPELSAQLANPLGSLRLLFVSNYNYYRNFETLLRALPLIQEKIPSRRVELVLTCKLDEGQNPGSYRANDAAALRDHLKLRAALVELGPVPYTLLPHVYRGSDIYVTPAYTETFAHSLVEAMSTGLPIVASDLAVHREICGNAATYFERFSPAALAAAVLGLQADESLRSTMSQAALARSRDFSWDEHVADLLALARHIVGQ